MPFSIQYIPEIGTIESVFTGVVTEEEVTAEMHQSYTLYVETGCKQFLADLTEANITLSLSTIYDIPDAYEALDVARPIRIAILPPSDGSSREMVAFYKFVCMNRGWGVEIFSDRDQAIGWLNK